jgi:lycopene beta-cyclase
MAATTTCDVAIVGAGLAGGLAALALRARHPGLDVRLIDGADRVGGNHLWSFFGADVATEDRWIVAPLVAHAWAGYHVSFPAHRRTIDQPYYSVESVRLDRQVRRVMPAGALMLGRRVAAVTPTGLEFEDGDRIDAGGVIDARGVGDLSLLELGWQKFVGRVAVIRVLDEHPLGPERQAIHEAVAVDLLHRRVHHDRLVAPMRLIEP